MKKMPTLFQREFDPHRGVNMTTRLTSPELAWVLAGESIATEKIIQLEHCSFEGIRTCLEQHCVGGIVSWKEGMPQCKIRRRDFSFMWPDTKAMQNASWPGMLRPELYGI